MPGPRVERDDSFVLQEELWDRQIRSRSVFKVNYSPAWNRSGLHNAPYLINGVVRYVHAHRAVLRQGRISPARPWDYSDKSYRSTEVYRIKPSWLQPCSAVQGTSNVTTNAWSASCCEPRSEGTGFTTPNNDRPCKAGGSGLALHSSVLTKKKRKG